MGVGHRPLRRFSEDLSGRSSRSAAARRDRVSIRRSCSMYPVPGPFPTVRSSTGRVRDQSSCNLPTDSLLLPFRRFYRFVGIPRRRPYCSESDLGSAPEARSPATVERPIPASFPPDRENGTSFSDVAARQPGTLRAIIGRSGEVSRGWLATCPPGADVSGADSSSWTGAIPA